MDAISGVQFVNLVRLFKSITSVTFGNQLLSPAMLVKRPQLIVSVLAGH